MGKPGPDMLVFLKNPEKSLAKAKEKWYHKLKRP
jgi:hypothetical protein